jgi:hypothetical protein
MMTEELETVFREIVNGDVDSGAFTALPDARHRRDREGALLCHQLLVNRAAQSPGHHPEGNAGRLHRAARSRPTLPGLMARETLGKQMEARIR